MDLMAFLFPFDTRRADDCCLDGYNAPPWATGAPLLGPEGEFTTEAPPSDVCGSTMGACSAAALQRLQLQLEATLSTTLHLHDATEPEPSTKRLQQAPAQDAPKLVVKLRRPRPSPQDVMAVL